MLFLPTVPDYPGVSQIQTESPDVQYGWPDLMDTKENSEKVPEIRIFRLILGNLSEKKIEIFDTFLRFLPHFGDWEELILKQNFWIF